MTYAYHVILGPKEETENQQAQYDTLIKALGTVPNAEFDAILAEGKPAESASVIDPELAARIETKIMAARVGQLSS